jgi:hypothetical protein
MVAEVEEDGVKVAAADGVKAAVGGEAASSSRSFL